MNKAKIITALCLMLCVLPDTVIAQDKNKGSRFRDNIYKSSQNQKSNRRNSSDASQIDQTLKGNKRAEKNKQLERKQSSAQKETSSSNIKTAQGNVNAKREKDDIVLVVSGEGPNKTEATKNALRSAIEQAYGTFVSASTEIMNDELVKDEIATVASGNIKSYKELSSMVLPNGNTSVSLSAAVSIGKLIQYTQSHGGSAEFAGQTFMMNIRMRELNKRNELKALNDMLVQLRGLENDLFDFTIDVKDPKMVLEDLCSIPVVVTISTNSTYELFQEIISSTLKELSLSKNEIEEYNANNMSVISFMPYRSVTPGDFHEIHTFLGDEEIYYLRNDVAALMEINTRLCSILNNAQRAFCVQSSGGLRREWIPSEKEIKTVYSNAGYGRHIPGSVVKRRIIQMKGNKIDRDFLKTQFGKDCSIHPHGEGQIEVSYRVYDECRIDGNFVQTQFGDKKGYSTAVPKGKGIVFNSIEHSFQYLVESLGEVNGFEVIRQSPE